MKLMLHYIKRHIGMFLIAVVFLTIETFADLLQPTFMSYIVDRGVKGQETELILRYGLIMLGITAAGAVGAVVRNIYASRTSRLIGKEIRLAIYEKVQTLSYENIDRLQPASIITRITNDVTQMQNFINGIMRIMLKGSGDLHRRCGADHFSDARAAAPDAGDSGLCRAADLRQHEAGLSPV